MRKSWLYSAACALLLSVPVAQATTVYTDFYDAGGIKLGGWGWSSTDTDSWVFDITTDGFNPATQDIASASIDLNMRDDKDWWWGGTLEFATLTAGGSTSAEFQVTSGTTTLTVTSLVSLSDLGTLDVTLTATQGDFYFDDATLNAVEDHAVVPVPAAAWLFGSGLLGLVGVARRKRS